MISAHLRYLLRIFLFAVLSEVPFDLMYDGSIFYPFHQNVLWTFLIALFCIRLMEHLREKYNRWIYAVGCAGIAFFGYLLGTIGMVDYYGAGVLMVLVFYKTDAKQFRDRLECVLIGGSNLWLHFVFWMNFIRIRMRNF